MLSETLLDVAGCPASILQSPHPEQGTPAAAPGPDAQLQQQERQEQQQEQEDGQQEQQGQQQGEGGNELFRLFVGGLPKTFAEKDLRPVFQKVSGWQCGTGTAEGPLVCLVQKAGPAPVLLCAVINLGPW